MRGGWGVVVVAILHACGTSPPGAAPPPLGHDASSRRLPERRPTVVHPLPPFELRALGAGPYKLGESLSNLLQEPPYSVTVFDLPGVVRKNVVLGEKGGVVAGGSPLGPSQFVAIVRPGIGQLEQGLDVGTSAARLHEVLGPPELTFGDRRIQRFAKAPHVVFLVDEDVRAMTLTGVAPGRERCVLTSAARAWAAEGKATVFCERGDAALAVTSAAVATVSGAPARVGPWLPLDGVVAVGPGLGTDPAALRMQRTDARATWSYVALRRDGQRLEKSSERVLYELSSDAASRLGATLDEMHLLVTVRDRSAGGWLVIEKAGQWDTVIPLEPVLLER